METKSTLNKTMDLDLPKETKVKLQKKFQPGCELTIDIFDEERNYPQLQALFAQIGHEVKSAPEWFLKKFYENLLSDLMKNGYIDKNTVYLLAKETLGIKSLSFKNEKSQQQANKNVNRILELIGRWFSHD